MLSVFYDSYPQIFYDPLPSQLDSTPQLPKLIHQTIILNIN